MLFFKTVGGAFVLKIPCSPLYESLRTKRKVQVRMRLQHSKIQGDEEYFSRHIQNGRELKNKGESFGG
jgi:hypothetical protein